MERVSISINRVLYERLRESSQSTATWFGSVDEYVEHILEAFLREYGMVNGYGGGGGDGVSHRMVGTVVFDVHGAGVSKDEEEIKNRLRALGYI
ncbi:MAG: hypothetical protein NZ888_04495 [Candidatus Nitrosocaldus sp.]|nr:hypothetical protein [Candidatus Nitrosocaldus sp.]MDW8000788.1 hypothetical protein [Candidatus Nitrosocaldus sp.]